MCHSNIIRKTLSSIAIIIGVFFIIHAVIGLYPIFLITILKQWPAYLVYLQQIHSDILTNTILSIVYVSIGVLEEIHHIVTGIILIISFKTPRYRKPIIVCGLILIFFLIEAIITNTIMDISVPFSAILGRALLSLFVMCYGLYLQYSFNKEKM